MTKATYWNSGMSGMIGRMMDRYDFVDPQRRKTLEEFPYSYSDHYLWRNFERGETEGIESAYTDRMNQWDPEKWKRAAGGRMRNYGSTPVNQAAAQKVVKIYFGAEFECCGFIQSVNVSSGYPLGVFMYRKKAARAALEPRT
jgi:hypothetical protein